MGGTSLQLAAISTSLENGWLIMVAEMPYNDTVVNEWGFLCSFSLLFLLMKSVFFKVRCSPFVLQHQARAEVSENIYYHHTTGA